MPCCVKVPPSSDKVPPEASIAPLVRLSTATVPAPPMEVRPEKDWAVFRIKPALPIVRDAPLYTARLADGASIAVKNSSVPPELMSMALTPAPTCRSLRIFHRAPESMLTERPPRAKPLPWEFSVAPAAREVWPPPDHSPPPQLWLPAARVRLPVPPRVPPVWVKALVVAAPARLRVPPLTLRAPMLGLSVPRFSDAEPPLA